jgi:hypothetical protein
MFKLPIIFPEEKEYRRDEYATQTVEVTGMRQLDKRKRL